MGTQYQLPPMMSGTTTQNVNELRNFLVRLVNELNKVETASTAASGTYKTVNGKQVFVQSSTSGSASAADIEAIRKNAAELRSLIVKTAQDLGQNIVSGDNLVRVDAQGYVTVLDGQLRPVISAGDTATEASAKGYTDDQIDDLDESLSADIVSGDNASKSYAKGYTDEQIDAIDASLSAKVTDGDSYVMNYTNAQIDGLDARYQEAYVAKSEYGIFVQGINRTIENTAKDTVESYGYTELIRSAQNTADSANQTIQRYSTTIDSQIRRGLVLDPDTSEYVTGIAIAQNLQFTGSVQTGTDGQKYYEMTEGQTFGLYTSTGWQFWIDGHKKGWYNSLDGMLHIANVLIENTLQFGADVQMIIDSSGRFGMKKITRSTT